MTGFGLGFLSGAELVRMTGASTPRAQAAWLAKRHIPFTFNGLRVMVDKKVAEAHQIDQPVESGLRLDLVR